MDSEEINHLLELARIELSSQEKEKISRDLEKILDYVRQLQEVDTSGVEPMTGGTIIENVYREDEVNEQRQCSKDKLKNSAFDTKGDYFKIPPVF
ncbi:MAG: Asp-tRNA(Asn)/Glu-tRNA(Gln) amidotransferase subunit GatC [Candidatus Pacebacteria bacterium]|nr:Asp-tRNA(Asn)/Glu-tRNA(Gln) amidotransferase subunit GatC [Candidatus Paceibacterota bacterium]